MMGKKVLCLMVVVALVASLFTGCSNSKTTDGGNTDKTEKTEKVVWKLSHTQAPSHFMHGSVQKMADYVSEKTDGNFEIQIYHSSTLGWEQEVLEGMQTGNIAMTLAAVAPFSVFVPEYNLFSIPGLFKSEKHIADTMNNENIMNKLRAAAEEKDLMEVGMFETFFRELYTNTPINSVKDLENVKVRVMSAPVLVDTFKALGANVTTTAWAELYSALQLGVVEGMDHIPTAIKTMKFNEQLKYGSKVDIFPTPMMLVASKPLFDKLPEDYKQILKEGIEIAINDLNNVANKINDEDIQWLKDNGMEYTYPDLEEFREAVKPVKEKYINQLEPWAQEIAHELDAME